MAEPSDKTKNSAGKMSLGGIGKSLLGGAKKFAKWNLRHNTGNLFNKNSSSELVDKNNMPPAKVLGEIYKMMKIMDEDKKLNHEMVNSHLESEELKKDIRNKEIIKALTGRRKKKPVTPRKRKAKKEEEPTPSTGKGKGKEPEKGKEPDKVPNKDADAKKAEADRKTKEAKDAADAKKAENDRAAQERATKREKEEQEKAAAKQKQLEKEKQKAKEDKDAADKKAGEAQTEAEKRAATRAQEEANRKVAETERKAAEEAKARAKTEAERKAAEEERKRLAEEERKRLDAEAEKKRLAEAEKKKLKDEETAKRLKDEEKAKETAKRIKDEEEAARKAQEAATAEKNKPATPATPVSSSPAIPANPSGISTTTKVAVGAAVVAASSTSYAKIVEVGKGYNIVELENGDIVKKEGTRNWRNNNPGNIEYGSYAKSKGAIGTDGRFAIFPSYEIGRKAKSDLIFGKNYEGRPLGPSGDKKSMIEKYAPLVENPNQPKYLEAIKTGLKSIGVSESDLTTKTMTQWNEKEKSIILDVMEQQEGYNSKSGRKETIIAKADTNKLTQNGPNTGNQLNQSSIQNQDGKKELNGQQQGSPGGTNTTVINQQNGSPAKNTENEDDRPGFFKKLFK